jgi:hypothetical protein
VTTSAGRAPQATGPQPKRTARIVWLANTHLPISRKNISRSRIAVCARTTDDHVPRPLEAKLPSPSPATASRHCGPSTYRLPHSPHLLLVFEHDSQRLVNVLLTACSRHLLSPSRQQQNPIGVCNAVFEYLSIPYQICHYLRPTSPTLITSCASFPDP